MYVVYIAGWTVYARDRPDRGGGKSERKVNEYGFIYVHCTYLSSGRAYFTYVIESVLIYFLFVRNRGRKGLEIPAEKTIERIIIVIIVIWRRCTRKRAAGSPSDSRAPATHAVPLFRERRARCTRVCRCPVT